MRFMSCVLVVKDMKKSRAFYEEILNQKSKDGFRGKCFLQRIYTSNS